MLRTFQTHCSRGVVRNCTFLLLFATYVLTLNSYGYLPEVFVPSSLLPGNCSIVRLNESSFYLSISLHRDVLRFTAKRERERERERERRKVEKRSREFSRTFCVRNVEENNGLVRRITCGKLESNDRTNQPVGNQYFRVYILYKL